MTITSLDKDKVRLIRTILDKHLAAASAEAGVTFNSGNCTFLATEATFKVTAGIGDGFERVRADLKEMASMLGLPPDCGGRVIKVGPHTYEIIGFDIKRRGQFDVLCRKNGEPQPGTYLRHADVAKAITAGKVVG